MSLLLKAVSTTGRNSLEEQNAVFASVSPLPAALLPPSTWRSLSALLGVLFAIVLVLFWPTAWSIGQTWYSSRTFSHGFLILPMVLYLLWVRRDRLVRLRPQPNYWGLPLLLLLSGLWLLATLGEVRVAQQFALVAMLDALIWTLLGTEVVRALWFPLAFLFFAVPFGESIIGPLQDFTAHFAVAVLSLSRVPAILENRTIFVPSGPWVVAEACSGIRYLVSSLVLGLLYASIVYRSRKRRALFVLASIAVPIVANGLRAYGIILLAYLTDNRLAVGVDHIIYGWIFFTAIQLLLFSVGLRWREGEAPRAPLAAGSDISPAMAAGLLRKVALTAVLATVVVASAPLANALLARASSAAPVNRFTPVVRPPWQPAPSLDHGWTPRLHPSWELSQGYLSGSDRVDLYLASYSGEQRAELVSGYNRVSDHKLWSEFAGGYRQVVIDGQATNVRWDVLQSSSGPRLVWTWYLIAGKFTADAMEIKYLQAKGRLLGRPPATTVISLSANYVMDSSEAVSRMQDFLRHTSIPLAPAAKR